jgi:hypothetical protein
MRGARMRTGERGRVGGTTDYPGFIEHLGILVDDHAPSGAVSSGEVVPETSRGLGPIRWSEAAWMRSWSVPTKARQAVRHASWRATTTVAV